MKAEKTIKSKCCEAELKVCGGVTFYYVCTKCKKQCDWVVR